MAADGQTTLTGPQKGVAGTAALPAWTFASDTTTGLYLSATGKLGISGNGVAAAFFDQNQVGTTDNQFYYANGAIPCPVGAVIDWAGATAPTGWLFLYGQEVSQTTYPGLYAICSTTYNTGGESAGNFRLPDCRGRATAGKDNMGGSTAGRLTNAGSGIVGTTLGVTGGSQNQTISSNQIPAHTHPGTGTTTNQSVSHTHDVVGTSGAQSVDHSHTGSGTTSGQSQTHTHIGTTDSGGVDHTHGTGAGGVFAISGAGVTFAAGTSFTGVAATGGASAFAHTHTFTSGGASVDHTHTYSFTSSGVNQGHTHSISITSGSNSANHTHDYTFTTGSNTTTGSALTTVPPVIVFNKIIFAGR